MEDAHISEISLKSVLSSISNDKDRSLLFSGNNSINYESLSVFGVFDGHGGKEVAKFVQDQYIQTLAEIDEFHQGKFREALIRSFHRIDDLLADEQSEKLLQSFRSLPNPSETVDAAFVHPQGFKSKSKADERREVATVLENMDMFASVHKRANSTSVDTNHTGQSKTPPSSLRKPVIPVRTERSCALAPHRVIAGCTAIVVLKYEDKLYVANAGDSRAVLCRGDNSAVALSDDHKPQQVLASLLAD